MASPELVELTWVTVSLAAGVLTLSNLATGMRVWRSRRLTGPAYRIASWANVRRDSLRLVSIAGCLVLAIPALSRPGDTAFSPFVLALMLIPVGIALNSYLDRRDRLRIEALL